MANTSLTLPVGDTTYTVVSPPAVVGLAVRAVETIRRARKAGKTPPAHAVDRAARYDGDAEDMQADLLGLAGERMVADGVPIGVYDAAFAAAYQWVITGRDDVALKAFEVMTTPAAVEDDESLGEAGTASTSTGEATTTKRPASTSGTRSRRSKSNS